MGLLGPDTGGAGAAPGLLTELDVEDGLALGVRDGVEFCGRCKSQSFSHALFSKVMLLK